MIKKALRFAIKAHEHQKRKGTDRPYIEHPVHVAMLLMEAHQPETVIAAGLLHDTLEDTSTTAAEIIENFGPEVLVLVEGASEPDKRLSWRERKTHTVVEIKKSNRHVQMISLCDKLSNLEDMKADYEAEGGDFWKRFNAGFEDQKWYYETLAEALKELEGERLYTVFTDTVDAVFGKPIEG